MGIVIIRRHCDEDHTKPTPFARLGDFGLGERRIIALTDLIP